MVMVVVVCVFHMFFLSRFVILEITLFSAFITTTEFPILLRYMHHISLLFSSVFVPSATKPFFSFVSAMYLFITMTNLSLSFCFSLFLSLMNFRSI